MVLRPGNIETSVAKCLYERLSSPDRIHGTHSENALRILSPKLSLVSYSSLVIMNSVQVVLCAGD
jgi:hypothetical protein